jgi:hypothetical protein
VDCPAAPTDGGPARDSRLPARLTARPSGSRVAIVEGDRGLHGVGSRGFAARPVLMRSLVVIGAVLALACACRKSAGPESPGDGGGQVRSAATDAPVAGASAAGGDALPSGDASADPAWQDVLAAARSLLPPGEHATLDRAVERAKPYLLEVADVTTLQERGRDGGMDRLAAALRDALGEPAVDAGPAALLPGDVLAAVDDLRAWQVGGGGLDTTVCEAPDVLALGTLVRAALALAAATPDDPNLRAVLYLSRRLREEGPTLVHVLQGIQFGNGAVARRQEQPCDAGPLFAEHAPRADVLVRAVAVDGVCAVRNAERALGPDGDALRARWADDLGVAADPASLVVLRSEVEAVRRCAIERLRAVRGWLADPSGAAGTIDRCATEAARDSRAHPVMSLVLRPLEGLLRRMQQDLAVYRAFLGTAP